MKQAADFMNGDIRIGLVIICVWALTNFGSVQNHEGRKGAVCDGCG